MTMSVTEARDGADSRCITTRHDHEAVAAVFRALAEPARLQIVHALSDGERRVVDLVAQVGLAQSTTSAHLAVLKEAGLVTPRAVGRSTYYSLTTTSLGALLQRAEELLDEGLLAVVHSHGAGG
ncbi:ArsR/SmtB family transcription factor [Pseudactinotalea suaedae]|uniref:ArsR/SmtB family transcription factor n=1 Tax=Pseudactinotalea suaedae TaxID=1524924 RepID=UPI001F4F2A42|nr:metalloregulator ArsR/SmtB family transcription factor [Pseudactinotalea suaedae]